MKRTAHKAVKADWDERDYAVDLEIPAMSTTIYQLTPCAEPAPKATEAKKAAAKKTVTKKTTVKKTAAKKAATVKKAAAPKKTSAAKVALDQKLTKRRKG